jgi:Rrf2 family protein
MLDLAKETAWGLFALHYLAAKERLIQSAQIAREGKIPAKALAPILRKLRSAGLLRGSSGHGYALAKAAGAISVHDVAQLLENGKSPAKSCMERYDACAFTESCALAPLCREAFERARSAMRSFTIADLRRAPPALADCVATRRRQDR